MSSIHYSQPPKNPNQPRLWLLLNQFLSYVFRNTRLCCLPALGKGKAKIRKSSLREDETNWSSLFSPEHHWLQHTGKRRQGIRTDGSRATLLMSKCFCIGCLDCSSLLVTGFVDPQQCATTPRLQAAGATTLHPCPSQGGRLAQWPGVASWYAPAPWQWPGWSYRKGSWVFHSCVLGFSSKSCVLWSPLTTSALLASAKGNGGTSAKNTFLWECIQLPPTSVPKSALKKEAEFSPIYVNLGRCYFQGYFKVNGVPAKIWTPFTLCLVPGVCLFRKEQVIKVMPAALP